MDAKEILQMAMSEAGETQKSLAEKLGVKQQTVSSYLKNPTVKTLRRIKKILPELRLDLLEAKKPTPKTVSAEDLDYLERLLTLYPREVRALSALIELKKELPPEVLDRLAIHLFSLFSTRPFQDVLSDPADKDLAPPSDSQPNGTDA